jgi:hypothetical protein
MLKELLSRHHPRRLGRKLRKSIDKRLGKKQTEEVAAMHRELALRVSAVEQAFNERLSALDAQLLLVEQHHANAFWHALDKIDDLTLTDKVLSCVEGPLRARLRTLPSPAAPDRGASPPPAKAKSP